MSTSFTTTKACWRCAGHDKQQGCPVGSVQGIDYAPALAGNGAHAASVQALTGLSAMQDDCLNIVMEYANSGDLSDVIQKRAEGKRPLTEDEIMFW